MFGLTNDQLMFIAGSFVASLVLIYWLNSAFFKAKSNKEGLSRFFGNFNYVLAFVAVLIVMMHGANSLLERHWSTVSELAAPYVETAGTKIGDKYKELEAGTKQASADMKIKVAKYMEGQPAEATTGEPTEAPSVDEASEDTWVQDVYTAGDGTTEPEVVEPESGSVTQ